jgi:two-component system phosphate regulon sensor histidine kinase PhoR
MAYPHLRKAGRSDGGVGMSAPSPPGLLVVFVTTAKRRLTAFRYPLTVSVAIFVLLAASGMTPTWISALAIAAMLIVCVIAPVRTARVSKADRLGGLLLAHSNVRTQAVLDSLIDPVAVIDPRGIVTSVNRACVKFFADSVQPGGSALIRFRSPEVLAMINAGLSGGEPKPVEVIEKTPIERWFEVSIVRLPVETAGDAPCLLQFRDLSDSRRIDRMRSDFIANASHELRTPLASLTGFIDTLAGPASNDAAARDRFLAIMQEQAARMSRLIDDLLSLSRLETVLAKSDFAAVDLADVLRHVLSAIAPTAEHVALVKSLDALDDPGCRVWGSGDELIQVFSNLVENAMRYGASGGKIDIVAERLDVSDIDSIVVTVRDYGPGIAARHIPRLTERFYRVDVDTSAKKIGTGLGLAIVRHILTRHQGRLSIHSQVGKGASFIVTLPVMSGEISAD